MKKILVTATVGDFVPKFEINNVRLMQKMGYEVHYASNFSNTDLERYSRCLDELGIVKHQVDYIRSPYYFKENYKAYQQMKELLRTEKFDLVHCHTPVAAMIARFSSKKYRKHGLKVVYTAHGFHFFKGAPLKNWLLFYTMERLAAIFTDVLVTINKEDYERARRFCRFTKTKVKYINGVGIDTKYWNGADLSEGEKGCIRETTRQAMNLDDRTLALVSVGELIPRKNHRAVICALGRLLKEYGETKLHPFHYYICGCGDYRAELERLIHENKLDGHVTLLGYRGDIRDILYGMDVFLFPSKQEGLPIALLEAATVGMPLIASKIRGNKEVVYAANANGTGKHGFLFSNEGELEELLAKTLTEHRLFDVNEDSSMAAFDSSAIQNVMKEIYCEALNE